jgi:hypothetical protein
MIHYIVTLILYTICGTLAIFTNKTNSTIPSSSIKNITTKIKKLAKCKFKKFYLLLIEIVFGF